MDLLFFFFLAGSLSELLESLESLELLFLLFFRFFFSFLVFFSSGCGGGLSLRVFVWNL